MANITENNFTDYELKFSYWYITHKINLKRGLAVFLALISLALFGYVFWFLSFYTSGYQAEKTQISRLFSLPVMPANMANLAPQNLQAGNLSVLNPDAGHFEFVSPMKNSNKNWAAFFYYRFTSANQNAAGQTADQVDFVFPGQEKYLLGFGTENSDASLQITDLKWQRVDNYQALAAERVNFLAENDQFITGQKPGEPNQLVFDLVNRSAYGYWTVRVKAFLYDSGSLVSVNSLDLSQFRAGEKRSVAINWNIRLPRITEYRIVPEVDFINSANLMAAENILNEGR